MEIKERTDVAPHRGPVDRVVIPYDGIDHGVEITEAEPCHEQAGAHIPRCIKGEAKVRDVLKRVGFDSLPCRCQ